jgi:hypothetical protein
MKKKLPAIICMCLILTTAGCFVFKKKEKYGCPGSPQAGELSNDLKIAKGEEIKKQPKYKGGRKIY